LVDVTVMSGPSRYPLVVLKTLIILTYSGGAAAIFALPFHHCTVSSPLSSTFDPLLAIEGDPDALAAVEVVGVSVPDPGPPSLLGL
jgi:hypothetical protein